MVQQLSYAGII